MVSDRKIELCSPMEADLGESPMEAWMVPRVDDRSVSGSDPRPRERKTPLHVWALPQIARLSRTRASGQLVE